MARTVDPAKYAERRGVILDAAEHQIAIQGYDVVTIADVMAGAGASKGALYHYFASKEELLIGVIERRINSWRVDIDAATEHVQDPVRRLVAVVRTLTSAKAQDRALLVGATPELDSTRNAAVALRLRSAAAERFLPVISQAIEDGVEAGSISRGLV